MSKLPYTFITFFNIAVITSFVRPNEQLVLKYLESKFSEKPVLVNFGIELIQVINVIEEEQMIELKLWLRLGWHNEFLTWNPRDYDNTSSIQVSEKDVWVPDIQAIEDVR